MLETSATSDQENHSVTTDVLIVGAGPTGLSLALQLMRYGISFVICDKKEGVTHLSKALVVHARTLEIYDQIGLADHAVAGGQVAEQLTLLHDGKVRVRLDLAGFGNGLTPFPFLLFFEQSKNETLLFDALQQDGREVLWQTEMESLSQGAGGVRAVLKSADGRERVVEARYVVGCDGASSTTRHQLGMGFEGSTLPRLFYVADVDMNIELEKSSMYMVPGDDSFALLFPMQGENHWRLIGNLPEYEHEGKIDQNVPYAEVERKVKSLVQIPLDIAQVRWFSTYKVHTRHARTFSLGRCFVAGDAAHIHTPAGGQGMNTGIQDAYNLAWKLALVLKGKAGEFLLETYNEERLANAKRLLRSTDLMFDTMSGDSWYQRFFRDDVLPNVLPWLTRFPAVRESLFPFVSQIAITYRDHSLSQHEGDGHFKVKAGDRMPHFEVGGTGIYDQLRAPCFHLLLFSDDAKKSEALKTGLQKHGSMVDFAVVPPTNQVKEIFGIGSSFLVLLRPDNYIALLSADLSLGDMESYFAQLSVA